VPASVGTTQPHARAGDGGPKRHWVLRLVGVFVAHRTADGPSIPAPGAGRSLASHIGPRQPSWPFFWQGHNMRTNNYYMA
jgi:hypothetical protein